MENRKEKVALNDELLDKVSGGDASFDFCACPGCNIRLSSDGVCQNVDCSRSPYYTPYDPNAEYRVI